MKTLYLHLIGLFFTGFLMTQCQVKANNDILTQTNENTQTASASLMAIPTNDKPAENKIQVALLLDTSNSMDGLIEQAKSRLWNIVNTLTTLKYDGNVPDIEIALYEYGNDGLEEADNYIRRVTPLTQDLDLISEKLFSLRTNGGAEYCGAVINEAGHSLDWDDNKSMKLIYIAGNEAFDQGTVSYKESIADARKNNIYINTIFCGDKREGEDTFWKDGADRGEGKYFNINPDKKVIYIATPYDDEIQKCNVRLNDTYIGYGRLGRAKKANQMMQDKNASSIAKENMIERTLSKSKKSAYKNTSWDLVDKYEEDEEFLESTKEEELPEELKGKSKKEQEAYIKELAKKRAAVQKEIAELSVKRQKYIDAELEKKGKAQTDDLGAAIERSILEIAGVNGFEKE